MDVQEGDSVKANGNRKVAVKENRASWPMLKRTRKGRAIADPTSPLPFANYICFLNFFLDSATEATFYC